MKFIVTLLWFGAALNAEMPPASQGPAQPAAAQQQGPPAGGQNPSLPRKMETWDDRVFDVGKPPGSGGTVRGPLSGRERYLTEEADYNSGQRRQWLNNCSAYRDTDGAKYRDCYNKERDKSLGEVQRSINEVEQQRQYSGPRRGPDILPLPDRDSPDDVPELMPEND